MNIPLTPPELATHTLTCPDPSVLKLRAMINKVLREATLTKGKKQGNNIHRPDQGSNRKRNQDLNEAFVGIKEARGQPGKVPATKLRVTSYDDSHYVACQIQYLPQVSENKDFTKYIAKDRCLSERPHKSPTPVFRYFLSETNTRYDGFPGMALVSHGAVIGRPPPQ